MLGVGSSGMGSEDLWMGVLSCGWECGSFDGKYGSIWMG